MRKLIFLTALFLMCFGIIGYADFGDTKLNKGMTHQDITSLQKSLDLLGYFQNDEYTTYYGVKTEAAVKKFQEECGLTVDGIAGKQTISSIKAKMIQVELVKGNAEAERKVEEKPDTKTASSRAFVDFTRKYLGTPYVYGASSGKAFDCSGFTTYVMKNYGIKVERTASQQFKKGTPVDKKDLKPGDLVFFSARSKTIGHVGIYIGEHKFIHASSSKKKIVINDLRTYTGKYQGARRYIKLDDEELEGENKE